MIVHIHGTQPIDAPMPPEGFLLGFKTPVWEWIIIHIHEEEAAWFNERGFIIRSVFQFGSCVPGRESGPHLCPILFYDPQRTADIPLYQEQGNVDLY